MNVNYRVKEPQKFLHFLKRFSTIEPSLLIEIENGEIKAKTNTPERSVVKSSKMLLSDIFEDESEDNLQLKFGLFNINKFIGAFKHFSDGFNMTVEYDVLDNENVGTSVTLFTKKLKVNFDCASHRIFTHITDEIMQRVSDVTDTKYINVELTEDEFNKITSLFAIDTDDKFFTAKVGKNGINIESKSFDLALSEESVKDVYKVQCYKQHFNFADREDTDLIISEEKLVFKSNTSDTVCVVSRTDE